MAQTGTLLEVSPAGALAGVILRPFKVNRRVQGRRRPVDEGLAKLVREGKYLEVESDEQQ